MNTLKEVFWNFMAGALLCGGTAYVMETLRIRRNRKKEQE